MRRVRAETAYSCPLLRQQRKADLAFTLCRPRDLPGKHNDWQNRGQS